MSARATSKRARTESESTDAMSISASSRTGTTRSPTDVVTVTPIPYHGPTPFRGASSTEPDSDSDNLDHPHGHDTEFWYNDGTVILVAKDVEFRVYRGVLAASSPVFKAMFDATAVTAAVPFGEHQVFACPMVRFTDSPEDLRHILRVYFSRKQPSFFNDSDAQEPSFYQISAYIRLGQKYELKELYKQSLRFLKYHYTDDFETWSEDQYWGPAEWLLLEAIGVVNLARLINEPSLLPTALLTCLHTDSYDNIMRGLEREDGTWETLSPQDLARCFYGSKDIHQATIVAAVRTFQDIVSPECKSEKSCRAALHRALQGLEKVDGLLSDHCPIRLTHDQLLPSRRGADLGTCKACTMMVKERNKKERMAIWASLPRLLDIDVPGWGEGEAS